MPTTAPEPENQLMRVQKFLARAGVCSRRAAEELIVNGRIQVNGERITALGTKVNPDTDVVLYDGTRVCLPEETAFVYVAVNKPVGVVTSCARKHGDDIVLDLVSVPDRIYPVGRLDKDSQGLVLLTNDGDLHNRLSHPSHNHEKEYRVTTAHPVKDTDLAAMARGMILQKKKTRKAKVTRISSHRFTIVLKQGLNRQIRKMVGKTGNRVTVLERVRMGNVILGNLAPGAWRHLTPEEIDGLTQ
ncbi:MAG: pseudouridine synthase [Desulfotignum sp.]|nr:pseudouridine synthase [Desulfotignum sp.]